ncbi:MAG: glycosyltransferase [Cyclobacteriaceae bacterium]
MNNPNKALIEDLLIVVVIYELSIVDSKTWQSLIKWLPSSATIYIYDNSPAPQATPDTQHFVVYHHDSSNAGVSKAYNKAVVKATNKDKGWVLLLDQDTELTKDFFSGCEESISHYPDKSFFVPILKDNKGIVSPFLYAHGVGKKLNSVNPGLFSFDQHRAANSGALIRTIVLTQVGGFDEKLPLDFSDIYLQEKLMRTQAQFVVINSTINHNFSGSSFKNKRQILHRYKIFSTSCRTMSHLTGGNNFRRVSLKRAFNLSFRLLTIRFIIIHFQVWSSR